jgi:hypothetical protein
MTNFHRRRKFSFFTKLSIYQSLKNKVYYGIRQEQSFLSSRENNAFNLESKGKASETSSVQMKMKRDKMFEKLDSNSKFIRL